MDEDGRREALERAYRDHADDVFRVTYAILGEADAAADATQETFTRAFGRWPQYDAKRPLLGWLHGIASHAALDALRRRRVALLKIPGLVREARMERADAYGGRDPADSSARRVTVEAALGRLRPQARAALVLRHLYGYDYAEIADLLGTSPGNVGALLSRSHASLREQLAEMRPAVTEADGARAAR